VKNFLWLVVALLLLGTVACSLPPDRPVTRSALMATRIYSIYIIEESPEEVMNALNTRGEAILEAKRKIQGKEYPVHVKLLATSEGIEVLDYDR
jgi:uncharacterized protein YcfL